MKRGRVRALSGYPEQVGAGQHKGALGQAAALSEQKSGRWLPSKVHTAPLQDTSLSRRHAPVLVAGHPREQRLSRLPHPPSPPT